MAYVFYMCAMRQKTALGLSLRALCAGTNVEGISNNESELPSLPEQTVSHRLSDT